LHADRVHDVAEVGDAQVLHLHRCRAGAEMYAHAVARNRDSPEESAWGNSRVEIVNLLVELTSEEVESDEPEGAVPRMAVFPDVEAIHEAHVGVEGERRRPMRHRVRGDARALDLSGRHKSVEVGNQ